MNVNNIVHKKPISDEAREVVADISYLLLSMLYSLWNEVLSQGKRISEYLALGTPSFPRQQSDLSNKKIVC